MSLCGAPVVQRKRGRPLLPALPKRQPRALKRRALPGLTTLEASAFFAGRGSETRESKAARANVARLRQHSLDIQTRSQASQAEWLSFRKQHNLLEYIDTVNSLKNPSKGHSGSPTEDPLQAFAVEIGEGGAREYVAATYMDFWARYYAMDAGDRHHYEIIRENRPCKLYFDIEFARNINKDVDGNALTREFKALLAAEFSKTFPSVSLAPEGILDLDSSTRKKFSRHLVCHAVRREDGKPVLFANCHHTGRFVRDLCQNIACARPDLLVNDSESRKTLFVDQGVYTKNRCFRMLFSSKRAKKRSLTLAKDNKFHLGTPPSLVESRGLFFASLIAYPNAESFPRAQRTVRGGGAGELGAGDGGNDRVARVSAIQTGGFYTLHYKEDESCDRDCETFVVNPMPSGPSHASSTASQVYTRPTGQPSNTYKDLNVYPRVDAFVLEIAQMCNPSASIKSKRVVLPSVAAPCRDQPVADAAQRERSRTLLCYGIAGSRYCGNVGREHKSNGVYYIALVPDGVLYQKCHDPDCRGYRSAPTEIPRFALDADLDDKALESELSSTLDKVEEAGLV